MVCVAWRPGEAFQDELGELAAWACGRECWLTRLCLQTTAASLPQELMCSNRDARGRQCDPWVELIWCGAWRPSIGRAHLVELHWLSSLCRAPHVPYLQPASSKLQAPSSKLHIASSTSSKLHARAPISTIVSHVGITDARVSLWVAAL